MQTKDGIELALLRAPLFCDLSVTTLQAISREASAATFDAGDTLFDVGDKPNYLYVLAEGTVQLTTGTIDGRESVIELLRPVDSFLMPAVLTAKPYILSAKVIEPVRLLCIPAPALRRLVAADPQLALTMLASLANQYRQMVRHVKDLRLRTAAQRLGIYLLHLVETEGNAETVVLPFEKKLIAARLHMTPESMSRAIVALRHEGVDIYQDEVHINDIDELRRFCQVDNILDLLDEDLSVLTER